MRTEERRTGDQLPREELHNNKHPGRRSEPGSITSDRILGEIRDYCRSTQTAESTFGRLAVNDGKLVSRLRDGAWITTGTLDKVRAYLADGGKTRQWRCRDGRRAAGLSILRQPPEISAVRLDLQRKDRDRQPDFARARQSAAIASGAAVSMPASATAPCCRG
jgi:hypothetical protein